MLNNRFMQLSIGIVVVKQLLLGAPTYCIALAGQAVAHQGLIRPCCAWSYFFCIGVVGIRSAFSESVAVA